MIAMNSVLVIYGRKYINSRTDKNCNLKCVGFTWKKGSCCVILRILLRLVVNN